FVNSSLFLHFFAMSKIQLRRNLQMRSKLIALIVIALAGTISFMTSAQSPEAQAPHERTITQKHFEHMPVDIKEVRNLTKEGDEWSLSSATLFRALAIQPKPKGSPVGSTLSLAGMNWAKNKQTRLLVLRDGCHFCSDSAPFYQRLVKEQG